MSIFILSEPFLDDKIQSDITVAVVLKQDQYFGDEMGSGTVKRISREKIDFFLCQKNLLSPNTHSIYLH